ncbi:MAG TPA: rhodanese-like domain-containing protein, partial [Phytomonospora sp.]
LVVERNVLEWRFDPRGEARLPVADYDLRVIVFCQEGYTSSLAASALLDLGLSGATDLAGGFAAWKAAGLPTAATVSPTVDQR